MKTIDVNASTSYQVLVGCGLSNRLPELMEGATKAKTLAIVSDSKVWPIYGSKIKTSLLEAGFSCVEFVFPAGEASKNGATYLALLNFLAEKQITRSDCLIALGGGVVGDLTGFAAATYLRGMDFIQVPTTLLAAVDASVGGKTAIDLPAGKNLAGAFHQPRLVVCDPDMLDTLPEEDFRDGCAEVIKYALLYDKALYRHLLQTGLAFDREAVIALCIAHKAKAVMEDEFDTGARQMLNLGHTFGHGIEKHSHFAISHGTAVAIGMAMAGRCAYQYGLCDKECLDGILEILEKFSLPTQVPYPAQVLYEAALQDKKRSGATINLILPNEIGQCQILPVPISQLQAYMEAGM